MSVIRVLFPRVRAELLRLLFADTVLAAPKLWVIGGADELGKLV